VVNPYSKVTSVVAPLLVTLAFKVALTVLTKVATPVTTAGTGM
jgi:hypothetical protein